MIVKADALEFLRSQEPGSIDLVFGSPPYEQARLYLENGQDMGIARNTEDWVAWMVDVYKAALHACNGLVAFVVEGQTKKFRYSAGPALLMADLHRAGICLRKPPIFHRVGIPGSGGSADDHEDNGGGADWLRNDWEWIICATNGGKLPWANGTACGHPPIYQPGGEMCYRLPNGERRHKTKGTSGYKNGDTQGHAPGSLDRKVTEIANPGNVIHCTVGGGKLGEGSVFGHQNEAPFPEKLAEFFILSFCKPGGKVCDPFSGSGTTAAVSIRHGRKFTGCDIRQSQVDLGLKRLAQETPMELFQ